MIVTCPACNKEYPLQDNLHHKPAPEVEPDAVETFARCPVPVCRCEFVCTYSNPETQRLTRLANTALARFQTRRNDPTWQRYQQIKGQLAAAHDALKAKAMAIHGRPNGSATPLQ